MTWLLSHQPYWLVPIGVAANAVVAWVRRWEKNR